MFRLVRKNLLRNKLRTFLTLSSVALALFLLCLLSALLEAMETAEGSSASRVVVRHAVSLTFSMPEAYEQRLHTLDRVEAITPLNWFGGTYKDQRPENFFPRFGSDPATLFEVFDDLQMPADAHEAWSQDRAGFIAGKALVEKHGWQLGDRITIEGDIYPVDLEIDLRGIFERPDARSQESQIFFHRRYVEEAMNNPGIVGTYWLRLDSAESVPEVVKAAEEMFANSAAPVRAETEEAFALSFLEMMGNVRLLLGSIGLAIVISLLFITANTMAMAARDRVREVAVLRTLGFRRGQVTWLVLAESLCVGLVGAAAGVLVAGFVLTGIAQAMADVMPAFGNLSVSSATLALALVIGLVVGLVSGVFPALSASRLRIVDGLRKVS
ncbi:MAG: FtsX-like permease family protein [Holophagales bacterium]|nr:FtsX-like permease family protein [Holophagales bacterium]